MNKLSETTGENKKAMNDLALMAAGQVCSTEVEVTCPNKKAMSLATLSPAHGLVRSIEFLATVT